MPYKFGEFELDSAGFELRRNGRPVKLERIPLELLILLTEKKNTVVPRQEIVDRLWGKDVFVDTEHGINVAIRKIRTALREGADRPRFLQTVPGKGYRFVDAVTGSKNGRPSATETASEINAVETASDPASVRRRYFPKILISGMLGFLLLLAGMLVGFNAGGLRDRILPKHPSSPIRSIAVLPLVNLSREDSEKYFADGMTDEIISMLAKNTSLRVVSWTSVMQYKGVHRSLRDIARELNVDTVLEGSVSRSANRVHVTVQLFSSDDRNIWADNFDRERSDALSLPSELAHAIAEQVQVAISPAGPQRVINPDAHDAYLHGRFFWFSNNQRLATKYFKEAIQIQPDYSAAWSGLADAYIVSAIVGIDRPRDAMPKAEEAVRKALELDDKLAEAHNAMAAVYLFRHWDLQQADRESRRAIELNPNFAEAYHLHAYILTAMNRPDEARQEQERSLELDPFARPWALGFVLSYLGQYDAALKELRLRMQGQPRDIMLRVTLSDVYRIKGMEEESAQELQDAYLLSSKPEIAAAVRRVFDEGGDKAVAQWQLINLPLQQDYYSSWWWRARLYARLGDKEKTLAELDTAYQERDPFLIFLQNEPLFDFLHSDQRYRALVKKMGLPFFY